MQQTHRNNHGFTLIELMIVVAIVGTLAAVAIPAYHNHINRSRQMEAAQILLQIKTAQERFYATNDSYAGSIELLDGFGSATAGAPAYYYNAPATSTRYYRFFIDAGATATAYTAKAEGDLNQDGNWYDCWQVDQDAQEPSDCSTAGLDENLGFSLLDMVF